MNLMDRPIRLRYVLIVGVVALLTWNLYAYYRRSPDRFIRRASPAIAWLEGYREEHGLYPRAMDPEYLDALQDSFWDVAYRFVDEDTVHLSRGQYYEKNLAVYWDSSTGLWVRGGW
jgi:hypothetical protein